MEMKMRKRLFTHIFILTLVLAVDGFAGEKYEDTFSQRRMDEVVVSATKTEESIKDIPNAVIVKDSIDIEDTDAKTVGRLLNNEQGIDLRARGDYGGATEELHIRGMSADGTQVLVNGVVVNSPSLGSANVNGIPMNNIERVEVVKGAGTLLYGTSAMGGIVSIITKRPERGVTNLKAQAGYGTNSTFELKAEQGMFVTDDLGYYITAEMLGTDGFRSNSDLDHRDASLNIVFEKDDLLDITLYGDYVDREFGRPGVKPPAGTTDFFVDSTRLYDSDSANLLNRGGDENLSLVLNANIKPTDEVAVNLKAGYLNMENYNYNRYYDAYSVPPGIPGSKTWVTNKVTDLEANANVELFNGLEFLFGAEYKKYDWENTNINLDGTGADLPDPTGAAQDLDTTGYYVEGQYRPCDYFKMIAGVRLTDHSEFGSKYVPRYGMIINPLADTVIKLNYGEHYNAPTPNDLYWPYEDWGWGMGAQGNVNLKPETGKNADAGIEQSLFDGRMLLNLTYFYWDINDKIRWVPDASYFYTPQNLDKYTGEGLEVGMNYNVIEGIVLEIAYTYSNAEEELSGGVSRQALYTAENYLKFGANYFNENGLGVTAALRYTGDRPGAYATDTDVNPDITLDSYYTVDITVNQRFFENWIVSLNCSNLLDEEYDTYTETFYDQTTGTATPAYYPGAGRALFLSLTYEF
jgi:outer membrane cobalamin receptor